MMAKYQCPICHETMPRDAALFLDHGKSHVIDSIKRAHPEWAREDGVCLKCVDYFQKVLRGEPVLGNESCGKKPVSSTKEKSI